VGCPLGRSPPNAGSLPTTMGSAGRRSRVQAASVIPGALQDRLRRVDARVGHRLAARSRGVANFAGHNAAMLEHWAMRCGAFWQCA
jgi:hypothetical protein